MLVDLRDKFVAGVKKAQTVVVGLGEKLHAARAGKGIEGAEDLRGVSGKLFEQNACDAVCDLESAVVPVYQVEDKAVGRKITLVGDLPANLRVFLVVEIMRVVVKDGVVSKPRGLMHLKVKAN
jgi:hypothetical protein